MTQQVLEQANSLSKQIENKQKELELFKEQMGFGGEVPEKIQINNVGTPYLPFTITNKVVTMVLLDTILTQYNDEITELRTQLQAL